MPKHEDLNAVIARNLARFMDEPGCPYSNANALSVATKGRVSPGTIRNLRNPEKRTTMPERTDGYPRIDTLEAVVTPLGRQVWELLHPDIDRSTKERALYAQVMGLVTPEAALEAAQPRTPYRAARVPGELPAPPSKSRKKSA